MIKILFITYVPPLDTQKKIGKLLSLFNQKISLNKKINKNSKLKN